MNVHEMLKSFGIESDAADLIISIAVLALACLLIDWITRSILLRIVRRFVEYSRNTWDDALLDASFFRRVAHMAPALMAYFGVHLIDAPEGLVVFVQRVSIALLITYGALAISSLLGSGHEIYERNYDTGRRPIKGYLSFIRLGVTLVTVLLVLSVLMDRSPWIFLSGLGAMTAVLLLVFKDTLLSLVASLQINSNDMIRVGDWVEMPQFGADGDVIDVALHTVKVQNWDKTITTIPTYAFITGSFKNWRGMSQSNVRRIKRSFFIDVTSIRFLEPEEIERFAKISLLRDYMNHKREEIEAYNAQPGIDPEIGADIRRLTNVGTLRAYIVGYLRNHPKIQQSQTLIVRQLPPGPQGLPIEIYCFSNDIVWANYEALQSDIFDHILAITPEFGLRIYQQPAGADLRWLDPGRSDAPQENA